MNDREIITRAMIFAIKAHAGQMRDGGGAYITHPAQVAAILSQVTDDPEMIAAAWLHDVIEDTETSYRDIRDEFGDRVADLVHEVTHEGKKDHKGYYFPRLNGRDAIMIKFADRLSNLSSMNSWTDKEVSHYLGKSKFWKSEV